MVVWLAVILMMVERYPSEVMPPATIVVFAAFVFFAKIYLSGNKRGHRKEDRGGSDA